MNPELDPIYVPGAEGMACEGLMDLDLEVDLAHAVNVGPVVDLVDVAGNGIRPSANRPRAVDFRFPLDLPLTGVLKARVLTIRHLPGALQGDVADALTAALGWYTSTRSDTHLFALSGFAKLVLRGPNSQHSLDALVPNIRARMRMFVAGDIVGLVNELEKEMGVTLSTPPRRIKRPKSGEVIPGATIRKVRQAVGEGANRKGLNILL